ncbi:murein transglycosylase A [Xenorhabdus nematophila]|uniref:Membrane-bound lytic murein transglycosylase A n=1 Tax=Xenorhabdus nematophila (strain ATCC 19061 / DSM 3370 / CCUG 14189 / LMG 1036 / NCIMB 9965 / AN6) TaxID=406817 RepID=D3VCM2_XENNA|nr:murein transglycosylase A [Xenorhabdus nematophila]CEE90777.1 membrane-bound lytic murein transglycosylase A [Xenorhabdus nematophila str. Anatoliense]CEF28940.1 membrane-bound lytic murein transglycosylase A [Xenorhabdus nematophila str. Websteri]AYA42130.1 murein transglycosylase A [Xenorhabdus nematophila]KHD29607.1 murein transglycosylase [Xenorhabdus nematophila]MBA0020854.1 murein transglycosylase A [Xenorhabdus nematophila]
MKFWGKYLICGFVISLLSGCHRPTDQAQQYKDGRITQEFHLVNMPNAQGRPVNARDFATQVKFISESSPRLYSRHRETFDAIKNWMLSGGDTRDLNEFDLSAYQMEGQDNYGNVKFTGYYTPVLQARYIKQGEFKYPLYNMPPKSRFGFPNRAAIYNGVLNKKYIIGYSNSQMDNFMMEVQGSGYVDFGDGRPLTFFGYGGKNGHAYRSIGKVLIDRGEVSSKDMSMKAIRQWAERHSEADVRELLEQNPSFVFFKPEPYTFVRGASVVPLVAEASVASDRSLIPPGTALLAEVPVLDNAGKFTGQYRMRLMVALDVGGAIKGNHFDIYHGVGDKAGEMAGFYNHYGRVWVLKKASSGFLAANQ